MIHFNNRTISIHGDLARQFDNLTRRIEVEGDIPKGWNWAAMVQVGKNLDIGQGMCGSSSGSIPTNVGQPMIRVSQITVGGR